MSKSKDKNQKANQKVKQETQLKIFLFGDEEEKNKDFIQMYADTNEIIERSDCFEFEKTIKGEPYRVTFFFVSNGDDKVISLMKSTNGVFILFDMSNRSSFDNILDKWLIWLRDHCEYKENIFIFGDFQLCGDNKEIPFLVTSEDEIQEVIDCSEIKGSFCQIGAMETEQKRQKVKEKMEIVAGTVGEEEDEPEDVAGSMKGGCFIV